MLLCALLAIAPLALAVVAPVVALVGTLGTLSSADPVVADNAGSTAVIASASSDSWIGREVDKRGRILPRRDAKGRFVRSDAR